MLESFFYTGAYKGVLAGISLWGAVIFAVYSHKNNISPIKSLVLFILRVKPDTKD